MSDANLAGQNGIVFNIQRYSVHDGAGIRTVVFLKGCPLRCQWCSNPESQERAPELAYNEKKCLGRTLCGSCQAACPYGALTDGENDKIACRRSHCQRCFSCVADCPSTALHILGKTMTVAEVMKVVETDSAFYFRSGGGLTISGGEPLMQAGFVTALLREAKRHRIDATIETCGYADWSALAEVAGQLSRIIFDIKSLDAAKHRFYTGASNALILDNFMKLRETFPGLDILVRTPVIPGFNDSPDEIRAIRDFTARFARVRYELLPYHRLGQQKYTFLGRDYPLGDRLLPEGKMAGLSAVLQPPQFKTTTG